MKQVLLILYTVSGLTAAIAEEILPSQAPLSRYTAEWEKSPFNRVVTRAAENKVISAFAKNIVLEGLVSDDSDGLTAYVRDRTDGSFAIITEQATEAQPLHIISHSRIDDPRVTSITISDGSEEAEISYEQDSMTRTIQEDSPEAPASEEPDTTKPPKEDGVTPPNEPQPAAPAEAEADTAKSKAGPIGGAPGPRRNDILPGQ